MFRFSSLSLAALVTAALVAGAQAFPLKQPNKPVNPNPPQNKPVNFNPNLKLAPPKINPLPPKPVNPAKPPVVKYYPKPYPVPVYQTVVEPIYIAGKTARSAAAKSGTACLNKETTAEGLVIFRDLCTNEVATTAVPGTPAAAAMEAQQAALAQFAAQSTDQAALEAPKN
jgi:hypothetical protein